MLTVSHHSPAATAQHQARRKLTSGLIVTDPPEARLALTRALQLLDAYDGPADRPSIGIQLARLAGGRFEHVRDVLLRNTADSALPMLLARYCAWTGDIATATSLWDRVLAGMDTLRAPVSNNDEDTVFRLAACTELQGIATDLGHADRAAQLAGAARNLRAALADRHLSAETRRIATIVGLGIRPGFDLAFDPYDVAEAAINVLGFIHGVLAVEPDAARGRIRIQPRLRTGWTRIRAPQIRFSDGAVSFDMILTDKRTSITLAQEAGAIPFTALLEPFVTGTVTDAEVDGKRASLDYRTFDNVVQAPVQLVLDDTRVLALTAT